MAADDLKKSLAGGAVGPLYFFYGDNAPLIDEAVRMVTAALFPSGAAELDVRCLDAQAHSPAAVLEAARTASFFSSRKLVVVRQAHLFKDAQWEKLLPYLKKPLRSCCLVLVFQLDEKDKKDKARIAELKKLGTAFPFQNPRGDKQIEQFVTSQLARFGKTIARDALAYFSAILGQDAQAISSEVEKLALYCGKRAKVESADIDEVVCGGARGTIFNLVDAVGQGRLEQSLGLLSAVLGSGVHHLVVLKMITRQFRLLGAARQMLDSGEPAARIVQRLRLPEFVARGLMQQARGWPAERFGKVFEELLQTENLLKASRAGARTVLEQLLLRLQAQRA